MSDAWEGLRAIKSKLDGKNPRNTRRVTFQNKAWREKHPVDRSVSVIKHPDKVMVARNEFHSGRAVWYYEVGAWACRSADDCLKFLLKKSVAEAQLELTRRGFDWEWVKR